MANEYDQIADDLFGKKPATPVTVEMTPEVPVKSPMGPPISEYDAIVDEVLPDPKALTERAVNVTADLDPDRHAKVMRLADEMQLPTAIVDRNYDTIMKERAKRLNFDSIQKDTPGLNAFMQEPDNAAIVKDDIPALQAIEKAVSSHLFKGKFGMFVSLMDRIWTGQDNTSEYGQYVKKGVLDQAANMARGGAAVVGGINTVGLTKLPYFKYLAKGMGFEEGAIPIPDSFVNNALTKKFDEESALIKAPRLEQEFISQALDGDLKDAGKTFAAKLLYNAPNQMALIAMGMMGQAPMGLGFAAMTTSAGSIKESKDRGVDDTTASFAGTIKGGIEAGFEQLGTFGILKKWGNAIGTRYGRQGTLEVMKDFAKTVTESVAANANEEFWTSIASDLTDYALGNNPDALKGIATRAVEAGAIGAGSGGTMVAPGAIGMGIQRAAVAQETKRAVEFYKALGDSAEATKLKERLPEAQRKFIEQVTKGTEVENIYLDPKAIDLFFQKENQNPVEVMQQLGVLDSYEQAKTTGNDVKIPLAAWVEKMVAPGYYAGLANDVKFRPDGQSANELKAQSEEEKKAVAEAAKEATGEETGPDTMTQVRAHFAEQFKATGKFTPQQVKDFALYEAQRTQARADDLGVDPLTLIPNSPTIQAVTEIPGEEGADTDLGTPEPHVLMQMDKEDADNVVQAAERFKRPTVKEQFLEWASNKYGDDWLDFSDEQVKAAEEEFRKETNQPPDKYEIRKAKKGYDVFKNDERLTNYISKKNAEAAVANATATPEEKALNSLKARYGSGEDAAKIAARIDKAQDPKKGPYVTDKQIPGMGYAPNYAAEPTGVIGPARISEPNSARKKKESSEYVLHSAETDPLKFADRKYETTLRLIKKHGEQGVPLTINTSSDLAGSDLYIEAMPKGTVVNMYLLPSENGAKFGDGQNRLLFPGNASRQRQLLAVKALREAGIQVNAIEPTVEQVMEAAGGPKEVAKKIGVKPDEAMAALTKALEPKFQVIQGGKLYQRETQRGPGQPQTEFPKPDNVRILTPTQDELDAKTAKQQSPRGTFQNEHTGWDIDVSGKGLSKTEHVTKSPEAAIALANIGELLKTAIYDRTAPNLTSDKNIKAFHYFYAPMRIGDNIHAVRLAVRETNEGQKFYHSLTSEEVRPAGNVGQAGEPGRRYAIDGSEMRLSDFESLINSERQNDPLFQREPIKDRKARAEAMGFDTSKIWYHGSSSGDFDSFDFSNYDGIAAFFTRSKELAKDFLEQERGVSDKKRKKVFRVYLRAKDTFDYQDPAHVEQLDAALTTKKLNAIKKRQPNVNGRPMTKAEIFQQIRMGNWTVLEETEIVRIIKDELGFDSMFIEEGGEKNIAVFNREDIRSVDAEFDPERSTSANIYAQADQNNTITRGFFERYSRLIGLLPDANLSTAIHELAHSWFQEIGEDVAMLRARDATTLTEKQQQLIKDGDDLLAWLGATDWASVTTEQQERFAEAWEGYVSEGKAPSIELKGAFQRFRVWMVRLGRTLLGLNVQMSPEIKDIFARMVATDEQIAAAQAEQGFAPVDPGLYGVEGKQAEALLAAEAEARDQAAFQLEADVMDDLRKKQTAAYKSLRKAARDQIEKEVNNEPVYIALSIMQKGKLPDGRDLPPGVAQVKLSKGALKREFKEGLIAKLPRGTTHVDGVHPDIAADMFGFRNGTEMVVQLVAAEKRETLIERLTDEKMKRDHGDLMSDPKLPEWAMKSIHNSSRSKLLRMQLEYLANNQSGAMKGAIKMVSRRVPTDSQVQGYAKSEIAKMTVRDLKPHVFQRAEAKAAKLAGERLAKGDIQGAFEAKRREYFNHELYRAAIAAEERIEKAEEFFKKVSASDSKISKTRNIDLVNAARAVLAAYGMGSVDNPPQSYLDPIKQYDPDTYASMMEIVDALTIDAAPFQTLTFDKYVQAEEGIRALWDVAKSDKEIEIDGQKLNREDVAAEINNQLFEMGSPGKKRPGFDRSVTDSDRMKTGLIGVRASLRRVESWADAMDGDSKDSVMKKYLVRPVLEAVTKYRLAKVDRLNQFLAIVSPIESTLTRSPINAPELGYEFSGKAELLGAILHAGNNSNLSKLLRGRNWGTQDAEGSLDRSRWDDFINRMHREGTLTKADWDVAQGIWDLNEEMKPDAQKAHKQMYGYYFDEVTANEFQTPFGVYRGGYVPAVADPFVAQDAAIRAEREATEKIDNSFMFPTTGRGFTKSRVDAYAAPLLMDLRLIPSHIDKALRFVHIEPTTKQVGRLVWDKSVRTALDNFDEGIASDMLVPWLQRTAQQALSTPAKGKAGKFVDNAARELRKRTGLQIMAVNTLNAIQQFTGFTLAAVKVRPTHLKNAMWSYVRSPGAYAQAIRDRSDWMKTRTDNQIFELNQNIEDILLNPTKYDNAKAFAQKHGYFLQGAFQNLVDNVTWGGAYDQAVAKGLEGMAAVREADEAVRLTQGSFNPEDISRFETGNAAQRLFTMFQSYFNMQANLLGTEFVKITRDMGLKKGAGRALYVYTMGFMLPAVLSRMIMQLGAGKLDEDDDGEYLDDLLTTFFGSQFDTATAMAPFVGPAVKVGFNAFNDKWYDDKISTSPAVSAIESAVGAPNSVYEAMFNDGNKKKAVRDFLTLMGLMTGLPTLPIARPVGYLIDVEEGEADPQGALDYARGLVTGKK